MSLAGLKKQLNKANQYLSEAIGGVEGTKLDEEFHELERRSDLTARAIEQVLERVKEVLQPNPATRARMSAMTTFSTVSGANQPKQRNYPQTEGMLGDTMSRFGHDMQAADPTSVLGESLVEAGEAFRQMAEVKYSLEAQVSQNFLDPLGQLSSKEIRDMYAYRKKLEGRRLDWDCKKRKGGVPPDEMRQAEQKFEESKVLSENSMYQLLDNEVEQVSQLSELTSALVDYHRQNLEICEALNERLKERRQKAAQKATQQHQRHVPRPPTSQSPQPPQHQQHQQNAHGQQQNNAQNFPHTNYNASDQQQHQQQWNAQAASATGPPQYNGPSNMGQQGPPGHAAAQQPPPPYAGQQNQPQQQQPQPPSSPSPHYPTLPRQLPGGLSTPSGAPAGFGDAQHQQSNFNNASAAPASPSAVTSTDAVAAVVPPDVKTDAGKPSAKALFDFDAENPQEMSFKEGEIIDLVRRIDENWFEGRTAAGGQGLFPSNYVEVLVPVPE